MRNLLVIVGFLTSVLPALGHDYWLVPETFSSAESKPFQVRLHLGAQFRSEGEKPFDPRAAAVFQLRGARNSRDLRKEFAVERNTITLQLPDNGTYWMRLDRQPRQITLDADKFNSYLAEEGLQSILEHRRKEKEDRQPGRERYSRCLKCLLQIGAKRDDVATQPLGQKLELVPQVHPANVAKGKLLPVKVLYDGKPLVDVVLTAYRRNGDRIDTQQPRTDKDGVAQVQLHGSGVWLIRIVHMQRCADRTEAEWESYWSALTFSVP